MSDFQVTIAIVLAAALRIGVTVLIKPANNKIAVQIDTGVAGHQHFIKVIDYRKPVELPLDQVPLEPQF